MYIEDNIIPLGRNDAMPKLKEKLNGYRRRWRRVYLGVTSNPQLRSEQHELNNWHKMVLLYDAYRPDIAISMEIELISYASKCGFIIPVENIRSGGEGVKADIRNNYLYILVGN